MLKKFGLEDSKPTKMPMSMEIKLTKDDEADSVDSSKYRVQTMEQQLTLLCDIDPMMDDVKVLARCYRIGNFGVDKPSVSNCLFGTKLYLNVNIPEIVAFKQRYLHNDGEDEKNHGISLYSPVKKEVTIEESMKQLCMPKYTRSTMKMGGLTLAAKDVLGIITYQAPKGFLNKLWWSCKRTMKLIEAVGPKYKVIVRVIDETCSASLLLFDDMIHKLVKMMSENPEFIKHFKKDFITEDDDDDVLETPAPTVVTPPSPKGKEVASSTLVNAGNGDHQSDMSASFEGSNGNGKRTVIDLDEYDEEATTANIAKK
ncbi:hypothetical protein Tco_0706759 [Tanacetum coccineum]|uniref:Uncharacterized protein n=1 Tax=Tanacetum coccineum TaxID=301880 RepID=A0ABQ4Y8B1_9ASTR